jgi:RNA polymerase sigma-70 factor (ECF subfamily)
MFFWDNLRRAGVRRSVQSDPQLLRDIVAGNADALGALYDSHARMVFSLAKRMLARQEDAEEVVQDVFAYVWKQAARYESSRASVAGWLVMLTRTRAVDKLRARRARPDLNQPIDPGPALDASVSRLATPEALAVSSDDARSVTAALAALPAEQRSLIDLAYFEGLSQSEIAERTGTPLGTVKTRMRTALQTMRAAMSSAMPSRGSSQA